MFFVCVYPTVSKAVASVLKVKMMLSLNSLVLHPDIGRVQ